MPDRRRLVIVDDEPELCAMVAEYLGRHGYTVSTAGGAAELDMLLAGTTPDLLILDVNMPGEGGFAIARRIRARSDLPIMMLTAADEIVDRVVGLELGADDYITKPFDLRELRTRIDAVLIFRSDIAVQVRHLMTALTMVVRSLDDVTPILVTIRTLGRRHVGYGVEARHFTTVGSALLATLEDEMGATFTAEMRSAWPPPMACSQTR